MLTLDKNKHLDTKVILSTKECCVLPSNDAISTLQKYFPSDYGSILDQKKYKKNILHYTAVFTSIILRYLSLHTTSWQVEGKVFL